MTPLLRRAATCAGLAAIGLSAGSQAQIPTKPEPIVGGEIRRPVPVARPVEQAAPPVVQQSPNGLFALSITDEGIELRGPSGGVKITNAGIEIGAPNSSRVTISATGMELLGDKTLKLNARETVEIVNGPGVNIVRLSPAGMELKAKENVEIVNGPSANFVKLSPAGMEISGHNPGNVRLTARGTMEMVNGAGPGMNTVRLSNTGGMELKGGGNVQLKAGGTADILSGSVMTLGCPGGRQAARVGDAVYASPTTGTGAISAGSSKVLICN